VLICHCLTLEIKTV